jgi:hypothetical protein
MGAKRHKPRTDLQLLTAFASPDYFTYSGAEDELAAWLAANPTKAFERAERLGKLALSSELVDVRDRTGIAVLPTLAAATKILPAKWDALVSSFGEVDKHRSVLQKIPIARRTACSPMRSRRRLGASK